MFYKNTVVNLRIRDHEEGDEYPRSCHEPRLVVFGRRWSPHPLRLQWSPRALGHL
jgi:hypothetical protein